MTPTPPLRPVKELASFVVRIYRRDGDVHTGLVEQVRTGRTAAFASLGELVDLLAGRQRFRRRPLPRASRARNSQETP